MDIQKKLKKLGRKELLEIILEQTKRIEELEQSLSALEKQLESKKISLNEAGTLADAALKLSDIFKNADEAVAIYKLNVEESIKKEEKKFKKECREIKAKLISDTETKLLKKAETTAKKCEKREKETEEKCQKREQEAEKRLKEIETQIKQLEKQLSKKETSQKKEVKVEQVKEEEKTTIVASPNTNSKKGKRKSK